ncbi:MAG: nucleotidyltransferase domain-containing protein [Candidatus Aenigmatarchaeota archaeon]
MARVIKVSDETYKRLNFIAGEMRRASGKPVSMDAVITQISGQKSAGNIKERIADTLAKRSEIDACYLFGSMARDGRGEDTDVGILLKRGFKPDAHYEGTIAIELESGGVGNPDVRILNNASLRFLNQVMRYGTLIFSNDERARISFESMVMTRSLDMKMFHEEYDSVRTKRLIHG